MSPMEPDACGRNILHPEAVAKALDAMPGGEVRGAMLTILAAMADATRLQLLLALKDRELCVFDLSAVLCLSQSAVSHQLRTLKNAHCVKFRREGKVVYYALDDEHVGELLKVALHHASEGL